MAISDVYTGTGTATLSSASFTPVIGVTGQTTKRSWVVGVRVEIGACAAAAGNSVLFQLFRSTATAASATTAAGAPHDYSAPAALSVVTSTWSTVPTTGTIVADWTIPQTTGSAWEEFPPLGYEWGIPAIALGTANAGLFVAVTAGSASSTAYTVQMIWSE
jgi:hypothetical protein